MTSRQLHAVVRLGGINIQADEERKIFSFALK